MKSRIARVSRKSRETEIEVELNLDGSGDTDISTGIGFLDHMFTTLAYHWRIDLRLQCSGDLEVDDHHTAEDCALAVGEALNDALGDRSGIARFGSAIAPLDESLSRAVVDISGRPYAAVNLGFTRESIGGIACENIEHVFSSLAAGACLTLHVDALRGDNNHHRAESAFKALALALREATARSGFGDAPSTKGVISGGTS